MVTDGKVAVAPTLLPFDDRLVSLCWVEAAVLPTLGQGPGAFLVTGVKKESNCVRSALNAARFLLLKCQGAISQLLGPPAVDLRTMMGNQDQPVDILVHIPQPLPSSAYAVPALLALITAVWDREPVRRTVSLGELNSLGSLSFNERLRPNFLSALRGHGMRKVIVPRGQAMELVREGGGMGDRWTLTDGVVVQGAESVMELVRAAFLGGDMM